jgi:cytochrome c biogenesis protein CcdA
MDLSTVAVLLTGLGLGFLHSLDPDHVVAVTALVCNNKSLRKSIASATVWGMGHSTVLLVAGFAVLILRIAIPESVVDIFELAAAALLLILGIYVLRPLAIEIIHNLRRKTRIAHTHSHTHAHSHVHSLEAVAEHESHKHLHKSAITGVVQGLGGSAALVLVTITTVSTLEMGLSFMFVFGIGVILGMVGIVCLLGSLITYTAMRSERVHKMIMAVTGSLSIAFGMGIILNILV